MTKRQEDARLLAESHRESCRKGTECHRDCPEASPLYWFRALRDQQMPVEARHDQLNQDDGNDLVQMLKDNAKKVEQVGALMEQQTQVLQRAAQILDEYDPAGMDGEALAQKLKLIIGSQRRRE